jgi:hypothetical protein
LVGGRHKTFEPACRALRVSSHALLFVVALFWITVAAAVGIHASGRGRSGFVWGFVTFILGIFGVVVYLLTLLITDDPPDDADGDDGPDRFRRCPECATRHDGTPNYCAECGEPLDERHDVVDARLLRSGSRGYCSNCKTQVDLDADGCPACGAVF